MFLEIPAQLSRLPLAAFNKGYVAPCVGHLGEAREHVIQEKPEPHAFAFAVLAHQVHAVVPVAGADERQTVLTEVEAVQNRTDTMVVQACRLFGAHGQIVIGVFIRVYRSALEEVDGLIQHAGIPRGEDIAARRERQPEVIVRTVGPHTPARWRMPPMLNISFYELTGGAQEQVLAHEIRPGVDECHHVLQLIAETEGAPRLVRCAARPQAARESLVQQPAVGQHVERRVGGFDIYCAEGVPPVLPHRIEGAARSGGPAKAADQVSGIAGVAADAEPEDDLTLLPGGQVEAHLDRSTGIEGGPHVAGKTRARHRGRALQRTVATQEFGPVAAQGASRIVHVEERSPVAELGVVRVAREERAAHRVDFGDHVHGRLRPQVAQHPFHIPGRGEPARSARLVAHFESRKLDRGVQSHVNGQFGADAALDVLEDAVAETVASGVRRCPAAGQGRGGPEVAALFIPEVKCLSARIAHGVVLPGSEAELVGILAPGVGAAALRDDGPEVRVGQHIHPRRRRQAARPRS